MNHYQPLTIMNHYELWTMMNMILAKVFTTFVADEGGWPSDKLTDKRPSGTGRIGARQISAPVRRRWVSPIPGGEIVFLGKMWRGP